MPIRVFASRLNKPVIGGISPSTSKKTIPVDLGKLVNQASIDLANSGFAPAKRTLLQVLKIYKGPIASADINYARAFGFLSKIAIESHNYDAAEVYLEHELELRSELYGRQNPSGLISTMQELAGVYKIQQKYDKAKVLFQQVLGIIKLDPVLIDSSSLSESLLDLVDLAMLTTEAKLEARKRVLQEHYDYLLSKYAGEHRLIILVLETLAHKFQQVGRAAEASIFLEFTQSYSESHPDIPQYLIRTKKAHSLDQSIEVLKDLLDSKSIKL